MKIRRITSLTALLSFSVLILTAIILYIVPQGRIAYWSDWRLWGLTKTQWGNIHIILGLLLLISISLHVYYNLNIPAIMRGFAKENIKASADMSLKKIAEKNNLSTMDVYEILRRLSAG